ncbi:hypothetical protein [Neorhodopirellula pilleata]|uniref:Secreted protein n=1 Tax=Neorhodopirellula pilleata TaxID=2714738 RepID=A0A5C5ZWD7_9BACT|nr:hypothetical protein [Neorhodopirellula pilleata]TWT91327.1 hypothetical protein Pla100_51750 [Neorhodopirellula pilleata]
MRTLLITLVMLSACPLLIGCGSGEPSVVTEGMTEAEFQALEEENERMEQETMDAS